MLWSNKLSCRKTHLGPYYYDYYDYYYYCDQARELLCKIRMDLAVTTLWGKIRCRGVSHRFFSKIMLGIFHVPCALPQCVGTFIKDGAMLGTGTTWAIEPDFNTHRFDDSFCRGARRILVRSMTTTKWCVLFFLVLQRTQPAQKDKKNCCHVSKMPHY